MTNKDNKIKIPQVKTFEDLEVYINFARATFRIQSREKIKEVAKVFNLYLNFIKSIGKFRKPEEWKDSREEYILKLHFKALEYLLGMFYLSESGLYKDALALKRNIIEIIILSIAIGHSEEAFIKWRNKLKDFRDYYKITSFVASIENLPELEKAQLSYWKKQYKDACSYSHALNIDIFTKKIKEGIADLGPRIITKEYQDRRLNTIRNLCLNLLCILIGIFDYSNITKKEKEKFPEAPKLIAEANKYFRSEKLKKEPTI